MDETPTITTPSGNASPSSEATIDYVPSCHADTEFDTSDEEPLAKYSNKSECNSKKKCKDNTDAQSSKGRGRPKGKAQPRKQFKTAGFNTIQRNVRCDRLDEECARLGIVHHRWKPMNPDQQ